MSFWAILGAAKAAGLGGKQKTQADSLASAPSNIPGMMVQHPEGQPAQYNWAPVDYMKGRVDQRLALIKSLYKFALGG